MYLWEPLPEPWRHLWVCSFFIFAKRSDSRTWSTRKWIFSVQRFASHWQWEWWILDSGCSTNREPSAKFTHSQTLHNAVFSFSVYGALRETLFLCTHPIIVSSLEWVWDSTSHSFRKSRFQLYVLHHSVRRGISSQGCKAEIEIAAAFLINEVMIKVRSYLHFGQGNFLVNLKPLEKDRMCSNFYTCGRYVIVKIWKTCLERLSLYTSFLNGDMKHGAETEDA